MGFINLPFPLFFWLDGLMSAVASAPIRLVVWGIIAATVSMLLYWVLSPQQKISRARQESIAARHDLNKFDGEFSQAWP